MGNRSPRSEVEKGRGRGDASSIRRPLRALATILDHCGVATYALGMEIRPTPDQEALIRHAIEAGRLHRPEEAAEQAMALWEEQERTRAEILARVDEGEAAVARGEGITVTQESMRQLAADVKQRGRARLEAENSARR
jgi:hypothetical protein